MTKIGIIITESLSLDVLYPGFFPLLKEKDFEVVGICSDGPYVERVMAQGVRVIAMPFTREFTLLKDIVALFKLILVLRREKFDVINYSTPKAAFLASMAGAIAGMPSRIYTMRGLGFESYSGIKCLIAKMAERVTCALSHRVICISPSLRDWAVSAGYVKLDKTHVIGKGSSKGADLAKFKLTDSLVRRCQGVRESLNIPNGDVVIGFAGRITREKGICELVTAFAELASARGDIWLLLVGFLDNRAGELPGPVKEMITSHPRIRTVDFNKDVETYLGVMDIVAVPTYREGFGNVCIEASALSKPVITTTVTGARDTVLDGVTGFLVQPRDSSGVKSALMKLLEDKDLRKRMGEQGRSFVEKYFDRKMIWSALIEIYRNSAEPV